MKALVIVVPILLIGGALGAGFMGVVNIPGITPKKAPAAKKQPVEKPTAEDESIKTDTLEDQQVTADQGNQAEVADPAGTSATPAQPQVDPNQPKLDAEQGAKALAKYWDEIDITKLIPITEDYKEPELAQVLFYMQKSKAAALLSSVDAPRAARISRELQRLASVVKEEAP